MNRPVFPKRPQNEVLRYRYGSRGKETVYNYFLIIRHNRAFEYEASRAGSAGMNQLRHKNGDR